MGWPCHHVKQPQLQQAPSCIQGALRELAFPAGPGSAGATCFLSPAFPRLQEHDIFGVEAVFLLRLLNDKRESHCELEPLYPVIKISHLGV